MYSLTVYFGSNVSHVILMFRDLAPAQKAKEIIDAAILGQSPPEFRTEHTHSVKVEDDFGQQATFSGPQLVGAILQDAERAAEANALRSRYNFMQNYPKAATQPRR